MGGLQLQENIKAIGGSLAHQDSNTRVATSNF